MYYLSSFLQSQRCFNGSVANSCTHKEQHVALVHSGVCHFNTVSSYHAAEKLVVIRENRNAHHSCDNRYLHKVGKLSYLVLSVSGKNTSTNTDKRLLSLFQCRHYTPYLNVVALCGRLIASYLALFRVLKVDNSFLNVHRDINKHRTRSARASYIESLFEHSRSVLRVFEKIAVLNERLSRACNVSLLKNVRAYLIGIHLTCYAHDRYRIRISGSNSSNKISCTRTRCSDTDRRLT